MEVGGWWEVVGRWEGGKVGGGKVRVAVGGGREGGRWEGGKVGSEWEGYGNGQVRFDRFDRRSDSMPVFAVGWLGMKKEYGYVRIPYSSNTREKNYTQLRP